MRTGVIFIVLSVFIGCKREDPIRNLSQIQNCIYEFDVDATSYYDYNQVRHYDVFSNNHYEYYMVSGSENGKSVCEYYPAQHSCMYGSGKLSIVKNTDSLNIENVIAYTDTINILAKYDYSNKTLSGVLVRTTLHRVPDSTPPFQYFVTNVFTNFVGRKSNVYK